MSKEVEEKVKKLLEKAEFEVVKCSLDEWRKESGLKSPDFVLKLKIKMRIPDSHILGEGFRHEFILWIPVEVEETAPHNAQRDIKIFIDWLQKNPITLPFIVACFWYKWNDMRKSAEERIPVKFEWVGLQLKGTDETEK